jgi:hypothetical protein
MKRKPKPTINPLVGLMPLPREERTRIATHYWIALRAVQTGVGSERDLFTLLKVCELMYIALNQEGLFEDAEFQMSIIRVTARGVKRSADRGNTVEHKGRWVLNGDAMSNLEDVLHAMEALLGSVSVLQMKRWTDIQHQSIQTGIFKCLQEK